jgi:energy-coupling factor transporter ATP-binding protein EcfA2
VIFENLVKRFDAGEVSESDIDNLLAIVYPDNLAERQERKDRVMPEGVIQKFQLVGLNKQAQQIDAGRQAAPPAGRQAPDEVSVPEEFLKDVPDEVYDHPDYVPEIKQRVGIVQAVRTWGKTQAVIKDGRSEGIKVRCPYSHHVDNRPSAWVNSQKNTWYCGKCEVGGDVIDFYAKDFHRSPEFARIVGEMADELGISIVSTSDGGYVVEARTDEWASDQIDKDEPEPEAPVVSPEPTTIVEQTDEGPVYYEDFYEPTVPASSEASEPITINVEDVMRGLELDDELDDDDQELFNIDNLPSFEWRDLGVVEDTFLHSWMVQAEMELDWIPPEFFMALAFQAIGMACGHSTTSRSFGLTLTGSTLAVLVGDTASGKSTATNRLSALIENAAGAHWDKGLGSGVKKITSTASAEALTQRIRTEIFDVNDPENPREVPTNVWYLEDELAQFISRSRRSGGEHIKQRVMRFHDFAKTKDEPEMVAEDHSLSGGYRNVHDSYFTATFLTQNDSLRTLAERADLVSGFFNRMIFFMGTSRKKRSFSNVVSPDPDPPYKEKFERMWKDCQNKQRVIPFSDAAAALIDSHPLNDRMETIRQISPMFSRWQHQMLRFAFLLAVNENSALIEPRHVNAAYHLVSTYIIPGASSMVQYVNTPEKNEKGIISDRIAEWVGSYFDKNGLWPEARFVKQQRWWKNADMETRKRSVDLMLHEQTMVQVTLLDGPDGNRTILLLPEGDFAPYYDANYKKYKYADFYDGRRLR